MSIRIHLLVLGIIFTLALLLRFYQLGINPAGLHGDGASQGYTFPKMVFGFKLQLGEFWYQ